MLLCNDLPRVNVAITPYVRSPGSGAAAFDGLDSGAVYGRGTGRAVRLIEMGAALLEGPHAACGMTCWA